MRSKFGCFWLFLPQDTGCKFIVRKAFIGSPGCLLHRFLFIYVNLHLVSSSFLLTYFSWTTYLSSRFCNNKFCLFFSVAGLNFDFLCYNILGYFAYLVYNVGLFYFKTIQVYSPIIPDNWYLFHQHQYKEKKVGPQFSALLFNTSLTLFNSMLSFDSHGNISNRKLNISWIKKWFSDIFRKIKKEYCEKRPNRHS